jgi:manganese efflux pump family protein
MVHNIGILLALLIPLTLDTFVLSAALGLAGLPKQHRLRTSVTFAVFEALMPAVGVLIGYGVGDFFGRYAAYIAAAVIALAGILLFKPADEVAKAKKRAKLVKRTKGLAIINLGISISLDELAIGLSLGLLGISLWLAALLLGLQAFFASQLGLYLGGRLSERLRENAEKVAGMILILLALLIAGIKLSGHQL